MENEDWIDRIVNKINSWIQSEDEDENSEELRNFQESETDDV